MLNADPIIYSNWYFSTN